MKYIIFPFLSFVILSCSNAQVEVSTKEITKIKSQDKSLSVVVKTKFDSEVVIEYCVYYYGEHNFSDSEDSINQNIKKSILNSLSQYEMYEMWASKRDSLQISIGKIIKNNYPKTEQTILNDVIIPEEAKKQFLKTDEARLEIVEALGEIHKQIKLLKQELEVNNDLSDSEITNIENKIETLESEWKLVQKKGKLLTYDYNL